ncbi:Protein of unknown function, partial [Gryllus bimaculatus]
AASAASARAGWAGGAARPSGLLGGLRRSCAEARAAGLRLCSHVCRNAEGGFACACPHGLALAADRRSCLPPQHQQHLRPRARANPHPPQQHVVHLQAHALAHALHGLGFNHTHKVVIMEEHPDHSGEAHKDISVAVISAQPPEHAHHHDEPDTR